MHECQKSHASAVIVKFEEEYLGRSTVDDVKLIMENRAKFGFRGAMGSLGFSALQLQRGAAEDQCYNIGKSLN